MRKTISATNSGFHPPPQYGYGGPSPHQNGMTGGGYDPQQQHHYPQQQYPPNHLIRNNNLTSSTPALFNGNGASNLNNRNNNINNNKQRRGFNHNHNNSASIQPNSNSAERGRNSSSPAYYYSSTLNSPKKASQTPTKHLERFHTKTTTLRSNKDQQQPPTSSIEQMDNKSSAGFGRRHTASGVHEFQQQQPMAYAAYGQHPSMPRQHIPAYDVEHLASFAVGKQFGLNNPSDGVRKLKQMERNSAICPVPMLFTMHPDRVAVLEENGTLVEEFPLALVSDPTAHISSDPDDLFNNVLLFIVREHDVPSSSMGVVPTEMHIFQCIGISAQDVAEDLHHYTRGHFHKVRPGRRGLNSPAAASNFHPQQYQQKHPTPPQQSFPPPHQQQSTPRGQIRDDISAESSSTEYFEMDVNTLNRCFDDIERFVARIQSAAIAQRELEIQQRNMKKGSKKDLRQLQATHNGILQLRAQIPSYGEFAEIFQKFKLCFNLLAKLKNHIHEPNAPELLHFLFTPLMVILDACQWGLGQQVAQQVYSPLLSLDACELLRTFLYPKEMEVWMALGRAWNTAPEDWPGPLPPPYRPVFMDGFAPYGYPPHPAGVPIPAGPINGRPAQFPHHQQHPPRYNSAPAPIHRGISAPTVQNPQRPPAEPPYVGPAAGSYGAAGGVGNNAQSASTANLATNKLDNIELERINLEKERLEFERRKVLDKEKELLQQERKLREEAERLEQERRNLHRESEKRSIAESDRPDFYRSNNPLSTPSIHMSPHLDRRTNSVQVLSNGNNHQQPNVGANSNTNAIYAPISSPRMSSQNHSMLEQSSPRQKAFVEELARRGCKIVQVTYDRNACNTKELTVTRGEYLEVLNDARNWWECRNVHSRSGFVPHTILSVLALDDWDERTAADELNALPNAGKKQRFIESSTDIGGDHHTHLQPPNTTATGIVENDEKIAKIPVEVRMGQKYVPDLLDSMRKKGLLKPRRAQSTIVEGFTLKEESSPNEVQIWLRQKGFSEDIQNALTDFSAINLFQFSREKLEIICGGKEEIGKLYSLLLAAKNRCNFREERGEKDLAKLLSFRRQAIDEAASQKQQNEQPINLAPTAAEMPSSTLTTTTSAIRRNESYRMAHGQTPNEEPPLFGENVRRMQNNNKNAEEVYSIRSYH